MSQKLSDLRNIFEMVIRCSALKSSLCQGFSKAINKLSMFTHDDHVEFFIV